MKNYIINLIFIFILFSSCSSKMDHGVVVEKFFEKQEEKTLIIYDVVLKIPRPVTEIDDADYVLIVRGFINNNLVYKRIEVDEFKYNTTLIGDTIFY